MHRTPASRAARQALHAAVSKSEGNRESRARQLSRYVDELIPLIRDWTITAEGVRQIAVSLIDEGIDNQYRDYPSAEQAASAIQSLAATLNRLNPYSQAELNRLNAAIDDLLRVTEEGNGFENRSPQFSESLRRVRGLLATA